MSTQNPYGKRVEYDEYMDDFWKQYRRKVLKQAEEGIIPIFAPFKYPLENIFIEALELAVTKKHKKVILLINSHGGDNNVFNSVHGMMQMYRMSDNVNFEGVVVGYASSNGFNALQACDHRVALSNSRLMLHWGNWKLWNSTLGEIAKHGGDAWNVQHIQAYLGELVSFIAKRTGLRVSQVRKMMDQERRFTAYEAKEFGLVDEIRTKLPKKGKD